MSRQDCLASDPCIKRPTPTLAAAVTFLSPPLLRLPSSRNVQRLAALVHCAQHHFRRRRQLHVRKGTRHRCLWCCRSREAPCHWPGYRDQAHLIHLVQKDPHKALSPRAQVSISCLSVSCLFRSPFGAWLTHSTRSRLLHHFRGHKNVCSQMHCKTIIRIDVLSDHWLARCGPFAQWRAISTPVRS